MLAANISKSNEKAILSFDKKYQMLGMLSKSILTVADGFAKNFFKKKQKGLGDGQYSYASNRHF